MQSDPSVHSWCEISSAALRANIAVFRRWLQPGTRLGVVVKSDAYGHGMLSCARTFVEAGADWLIVNSAREAEELRQDFAEIPIYICGNVSAAQADLVAWARARAVLYDLEVARALAQAGRKAGSAVRVHLKLETGMHRQGLCLEESVELAKGLSRLEGIQLEGLTTHYASSDEAADHDSARQQFKALQEMSSAFRELGFEVPMVHSANSAATILLPEVHGSLVRVGIAAYGLWPSRATCEAVRQR